MTNNTDSSKGGGDGQSSKARGGSSKASTADTHYVYEYVEREPTPPHYLDARSYAMKRGCNCTEFTEDHYRELPTPYNLPPYVSFIERLSAVGERTKK